MTRKTPGDKLHAPPRICVATARNFKRRAFRCGHYEAQDVLLEIDDVDLIPLEAGPRFEVMESWQRRLLYRDISRKLIFLNPGIRKVKLSKKYDVFVAHCQNYWDLLYINAIEGWRECCKTTVCWMDELWAADLPQFKYWIHAFALFDHIFLGCRGTVTPLSRTIHRECRWLPNGVDAIRFNPYPNPPSRVIDIYSFGRRREGIHNALLGGVTDSSIFYVHDTLQSVADMEPYDHRQHRDLLANMAKRSRYLLVASAKMDACDEGEAQVEIGDRYYEGAAAGAIMIGQSPDDEAFREMFPWENAVIPLRPDGSDVIEVLKHLNSEPEQLEEISRINAREASLRHDWVYRWEEILRVAGIEPSPGMMDRKRRLRQLAEQAAGEADSRG